MKTIFRITFVFFIAFFIFGLLISGILLLSKISEDEEEEETSDENIEEEASDLNQIDKDKYTFYYPKDYEEDSSGQETHKYKSSKTNIEGMHHLISLATIKDDQDVSESFCLRYGQFLEETYKTAVEYSDYQINLTRFEMFEDGQNFGCDIEIDLESTNLSAKTKTRIFNKEGSDNYFVLSILYTFGSEDADLLEEAYTKFTLK